MQRYGGNLSAFYLVKKPVWKAKYYLILFVWYYGKVKTIEMVNQVMVQTLGVREKTE
jgi:hypothetical protein